jgi:hypothetical protein
MRFFIVRIDALAEHRESLLEWIVTEHLPGIGAIPGLAEGAACYRAVETPTAVRAYPGNPEFTVVYPLEHDVDVVALVNSKRFLDWWLEAVSARFLWTANHRWVVCEQKLGPETAFSEARILFSEVDVAPGHEDSWGPWYARWHVPDALAVPGLFGDALRRFESIDIVGERWHCSAVPRYMQLLPIRPGADVMACTATDEFLALAADTQAMWGGALRFLSTICERVDALPSA